MENNFYLKDSMNALNVHAYPSSLVRESRMLKITRTIAEAGFVDKILLVGCLESGLEEHEKIDDTRSLWRIPLKTGERKPGKIQRTIQVIEWQLKLYFKLKHQKVKIFNSHNLASLPIGVLFKKLHGAKLVYDTHEIETEREWPSHVRWLGRLVERTLINSVDLTVVVSPAIADWYRSNHGVKEICVVLNFPNKFDLKDGSKKVFREKYAIKDDEIIFIYQGLLARGRGVDILLEVFSRCDKSKHIVFMGFGEMEEDVKTYERMYRNIHFHPAVKPDDIMKYTIGADVGFHLLEDTNLNHRITIGNKPFEYILCGIPCIESDFTAVSPIISQYDCGWSVRTEVEYILKFVNELTEEKIAQKAASVMKNRHHFSWESEEEKMLNAYRKMLGISNCSTH